MPLRDYQKELVAQIHERFEENQSVLLQMPTGTGKTMVFSKIIKDFLDKYPNRRIFILVHRKELLHQAQDRLYKDYSITSCTIASGQKTDLNYRVIVGMVQTLKNRYFSGINRHPSLLIIDEAHHTASDTYEDIIKYLLNNDSKMLGVTATPIRLDGKLLNKYYNTIIVSKSLRWFIENNYLAKLKYFGASNIHLSQLKLNSSKLEFDIDASYQLMSNKKIIKDVIDSILTFAKEKKILIFTVNQEHSRILKEKLNAIGIKSEFVDSKTDKNIRAEIISKFKKNEINVLINVEIFTEGFDCPDIEVVVLARPTKSLTLYLQMIGRVTRNPNYPNSITGIILDNAGNWREHGLPTYEHNWEKEFHIDIIYSTLNENDDVVPVPDPNIKTKNRKLNLPVEVKNLPMLELLIDNDQSYDLESLLPYQIDTALSINNQSDPFLLPEFLYEIEDNLYYQINTYTQVFIINKSGNFRVLSRAYFGSIEEYRKHIIKKSAELSEKIYPLIIQENKDLILYLLDEINQIEKFEKIDLEKIYRFSIIPNTVNEEDLKNRIFLWLFNLLKIKMIL
jgi:superfamily II DNA or RNA helicase